MEASWCVTLSDQPCSYMQQKFSFAVICHNFLVFFGREFVHICFSYKVTCTSIDA